MKALPWIVAAIAIGIAVIAVANSPQTQYAVSNKDLEDAADQTGAWGSKERVKGTGGSLMGTVKQGVGEATGDSKLQGEGMLDEAVGSAKDAAGKAAHAVSDTLHNANRS